MDMGLPGMTSKQPLSLTVVSMMECGCYG